MVAIGSVGARLIFGGTKFVFLAPNLFRVSPNWIYSDAILILGGTSGSSSCQLNFWGHPIGLISDKFVKKRKNVLPKTVFCPSLKAISAVEYFWYFTDVFF